MEILVIKIHHTNTNNEKIKLHRKTFNTLVENQKTTINAILKL